jgi:ABC-type glutathione transport system ATPase component
MKRWPRKTKKTTATSTVRNIRRNSRRRYSGEEKIRIVLEGLMSNSIAIRIDNLHKHIGRRRSKRVQMLQNLKLEVAAGQVFGFLGPNGVGKATAIRTLLDLIRPSQGNDL